MLFMEFADVNLPKLRKSRKYFKKFLLESRRSCPACSNRRERSWIYTRFGYTRFGPSSKAQPRHQYIVLDGIVSIAEEKNAIYQMVHRLIHEQDEIIQQFPRPAAAIQAGFEQGAKCLVATKDVARKQYFLVMQPGSRL